MHIFPFDAWVFVAEFKGLVVGVQVETWLEEICLKKSHVRKLLSAQQWSKRCFQCRQKSLADAPSIVLIAPARNRVMSKRRIVPRNSERCGRRKTTTTTKSTEKQWIRQERWKIYPPFSPTLNPFPNATALNQCVPLLTLPTLCRPMTICVRWWRWMNEVVSAFSDCLCLKANQQPWAVVCFILLVVVYALLHDFEIVRWAH